MLSTDLCGAGRRRRLLSPLHLAGRRHRGGGPDHGDLHRVRARVADPAARCLRPRQHPGPRDASPLPARHPPARCRRCWPPRPVGAAQAATLLGLLGVTIGLARGALGVLIALLAVLLSGAVLHHAGPVRDHRTGRAAALAPRKGLRRPADHPDLRGVRGLHPDRAEAGRRGRADLCALRGRGPLAAVDTAGPGRARDPEASTGHPGTALLRLALLAGIIAVLGLAWIRSLRRAMVTTDTSTQSAVRGSALPSPGTACAGRWPPGSGSTSAASPSP